MMLVNRALPSVDRVDFLGGKPQALTQHMGVRIPNLEVQA